MCYPLNRRPRIVSLPPWNKQNLHYGVEKHVIIGKHDHPNKRTYRIGVQSKMLHISVNSWLPENYRSEYWNLLYNSNDDGVQLSAKGNMTNMWT